MGGGIAALVAEHFHDHGININIFSQYSFSTITNVVVGWIYHFFSGYNSSFLSRFLARLANPFIKFGVSIVKWEMPAASAYKRQPNENKQHILIKSSKEDRKERRPNDDFVIGDYASLHAALEGQRRTEKRRFLRKNFSGWGTSFSTTASLKRRMNEKGQEEVSKAYENKFRGRKMTGDHGTLMENLQSRVTRIGSGQAFFESFVKEVRERNRESRLEGVGTECSMNVVCRLG